MTEQLEKKSYNLSGKLTK